jgi:hypothetical protein
MTARNYVGRAWAADGAGPQAFSCWGLVREVFKHERGVTLPELSISPRGEIVPTEVKQAARITGIKPVGAVRPQAGDIVLMRSLTRLHVGYVTMANGRLSVLHSAEGAGVVCQPWRDAVDGMGWTIWRQGSPDDFVELADIPQNRDLLRGVLTVASLFIPQLWGLQGLQAFIAVTAAQLAINAVLPPTNGLQQDSGPEQTGNNFRSSLSGNQARLDQPIWKVCGRREITPPFACQPYLEYLPREGQSDEDLDREQFYYALFAVGVGDHEIAAAKIGNTPLSRFADVQVAQYLEPGEQPGTVLANVTTAGEVAGQVLEPGVYVGGFAACAARRTCQSVGIDVVATRGLGKTSDLTVQWRVEWRPINDFGQALDSWSTLATESRTAFTSTPQKWTETYEFGTSDPQRVEIRVVRIDEKDTDPSALHEIAWTGLRAYLAEPAPLNADTAHYEVVLRASSQLSSSSSNDVRLIVEAKCRTLVESTSEGLEWTEAVHTRNPAWWALDLVTSSTWGLNRPDEYVDLQSFYDLAQTCDERQDRFDWVFDSTMDGWSALQLIARTARARAFRRGVNGVVSIARDQLADTPVTIFTPRNCTPGSMGVSEALRTRKSPDGVVIEYQDHRTWEWTEIECQCPGVSEMTNPVRKRIEGITGATHAEREGRYEAANIVYRRRTMQWTTEMQGILPAYMDPVGVALDVPGYGSSGDVAFWDVGTLTMGLSEPPDWTQAPLYLTLIRDDGTTTDPVEVTEGAEPNEVILPGAPDFTLVLDDGTRERPKYVLGATDTVKVIAIEDGGQDDDAQLYKLTGIIDDDRVHEADIDLLPQSDEEQDPVGNPDDDAGGGDALVVQLINQTIYAESAFAELTRATLTFHSDGETEAEAVGNAAATVSPLPTPDWLLSPPHDTGVTGTFEIRATLLTGTLTTGTTGAWTALSSDFVLEVAVTDDENLTAIVRVEIRDAGGIVQDTATYTLTAINNEGGG